MPKKRSRKSQTPQRGLQPQGSADNTSSEGEGTDHGYSSSTTASSSCFNNNVSLGDDGHQHKKSKFGRHERHQQHESDDNNMAAAEGRGSVPELVQTPLSDRAFKKESGQVQTPHAEVRSVETIAFKGDRFHFTHRFWRGKLLRRRFDFYGTYSIVPTSSPSPSSSPVSSPSPSPSPSLSSSLDSTKPAEPSTSPAAIAAAAGLMSFASSPGEKDGAAGESRLKELTEGKVILHWPSKLDAPELRDWQFDKSYSHLFLAAASSSEPGSTSSPVLEQRLAASGARKRPHFLYTKHSAVFIEEETC